MGEWLIAIDDRAESVLQTFEQTLSTLISRHFQPKLADRIFDQVCTYLYSYILLFKRNEGSAGIDWLPDLIAHHNWYILCE